MIDQDALLQPIPGDNPAGETLAFSEFYDAINEARREDSQVATAGIWAVEPKRANWDAVIELSIEGLTARSKDLQLAVWLTEALLHRDGVKGFTEGIRLIAALCDIFWATLYPAIEEDDIEERLSQLVALENRAIPALMQMPLTIADPKNGKEYTLQHLIAAQRMEPLAASNPKAYKAAIDAGDVSVAAIMAIAARTPAEFYQQLYADVQACQTALGDLDRIFGARSGGGNPGFTKLFGLMGDLHKTIGRLGGGRIMIGEAVDAGAAADNAVPAEGAAPRRASISSRDEAYRHLDDAANYLLATEPHSPVPYLVKRAIRWGDLPLGSLLSELLEDDERTKRLFRLLSISP